MDRKACEKSVRKYSICTYSRSSGPGGQNVNKVNTRVQLAIPLDLVDGLNEQEKERLRTGAGTMLNREGMLQVAVDSTRSQGRNRKIAEARMTARIIELAIIPTIRKPTKVTKAARERRLLNKRMRSRQKQDRKTVTDRDC